MKTITLPVPEHVTPKTVKNKQKKKKETEKNNTAIFSKLTAFVALDFGEKFVYQQKISTLHCHKQILFFPHGNQSTQMIAVDTKGYLIVRSVTLQSNGFH